MLYFLLIMSILFSQTQCMHTEQLSDLSSQASQDEEFNENLSQLLHKKHIKSYKMVKDARNAFFKNSDNLRLSSLTEHGIQTVCNYIDFVAKSNEATRIDSSCAMQAARYFKKHLELQYEDRVVAVAMMLIYTDKYPNGLTLSKETSPLKRKYL